MEVRRVVLSPGEPYELRLTGRGARGYVWTWQVTGDADAVSVTPGPAVAQAVPPGAAVALVHVVRARPPGGRRARIRFAQVRPPYPDEAPYDEFVLDVEVRPGAGGADGAG
ncbi:hypothetical protein [Streptomyces sp. NRRL F-2664]|uniref:hypothetical protein n=1 Tax=Streptomyces sp. NRRL F-2664 TaxID=1463842 RepID=UPI000AB96167|nr:hypothetical protein [Streptomyces sp. NRRL F-2664]